jgi:hypothetical protein
MLPSRRLNPCGEPANSPTTSGSDLKANPSKLLEKYFDAFVYLANWGRVSFVFALRRNRSTRGCWRPWK